MITSHCVVPSQARSLNTTSGEPVIASGKDMYQSVIDSGISRLNPVMMAALTTILGMIPLLADAFFKSMAVTIMFGLLVATVLTLIVVPVLYTIFFKIPNPKS